MPCDITQYIVQRKLPPRLEEFPSKFSKREEYLIKTIGKWALSSVQLTVGSTEGATERNKPFPRKVCITACCAILRTKHCVNRNGGMHSCAARQEGNYTLTQSSDSHSWSSAHKKHTGTVPSWTQAVRPTQNTDLCSLEIFYTFFFYEHHNNAFHHSHSQNACPAYVFSIYLLSGQYRYLALK